MILWRRRIRNGMAALLACAALAPGAAAAQDAPKNRCQVNAYSIDPDPKGVNVRGGPSATAKIVGVIKAKDEAQVTIVGETAGWFRITQYWDSAADKDVKLAGWVHGSRLGTGLMIMQGSGPKLSEPLRESPSDAAKTLAIAHWEPVGKTWRLAIELPGGKRENIDISKPNAVSAVLLGCQGTWLHVRIARHRGWVPIARTCGNPVTTCN